MAAAPAAPSVAAAAATTAAAAAVPPLSAAELTDQLRTRLAAHPLAKTKCSLTVTVTATAAATTTTGSDGGGYTLTVNGSIPVRPYGSELNLLLDEFVHDHATQIARVERNVTFTEPPGKLNTSSAAAATGNGTAAALGVPDAELVLYNDDEPLLARKIAWLTRHTRAARHLVLYTGAGISTAARIPDFRGPDGVWTRRDRGQAPPKSVALEAAAPTYAHRVLCAFLTGQLPADATVSAAGSAAPASPASATTATAAAASASAASAAASGPATIKPVAAFLTSQNIDGLHRRSGVPASAIAELHGNAYLETCAHCGREHMRHYDVCVTKGPHHFAGATDPHSTASGISHLTGRRCESCPATEARAVLRDSIVHFGESLPERALDSACEHAAASDFSVCLGTSLHVQPACNLPEQSAAAPPPPAAAKAGSATLKLPPKQTRGPMCIVNLQSTGKDRTCLGTGGILIHAKADRVAQLWSAALGLHIPMTDAEVAAQKTPDTPAEPQQHTQQPQPGSAAAAATDAVHPHHQLLPSSASSSGSGSGSGGAGSDSKASPVAATNAITNAANVAVSNTALGNGANVNLRAAAQSPFAALAAKFALPTHHTSLLVSGHRLDPATGGSVGAVKDVKPAAPSQVVHLLNCGPGTTYHVTGRCAKLIVEGCTRVHVVVRGPLLASALEIIRCRELRVTLHCPAHTFTVDTTSGLRVRLSRAEYVHRLVLTGDTQHVAVAVGGTTAEQEKEKAAGDAKSAAPSASATTSSSSAAAAPPAATATAAAAQAATADGDEDGVVYRDVPEVKSKFSGATTATDQFLVLFDAFGVPTLEPLIRQGCVLGTAKEHADAALKAERQAAAMQRAVEEMIRFVPAPPGAAAGGSTPTAPAKKE